MRRTFSAIAFAQTVINIACIVVKPKMETVPEN
jgi:hypothetical protein